MVKLVKLTKCENSSLWFGGLIALRDVRPDFICMGYAFRGFKKF